MLKNFTCRNLTGQNCLCQVPGTWYLDQDLDLYLCLHLDAAGAKHLGYDPCSSEGIPWSKF